MHALPSLQVVPLATIGLLQVPVAGLYVPAKWHASLATHVGVPATLKATIWMIQGPVGDCVAVAL